MSVTLFFGLRLSGRPYQRIAQKLSEDSFSTCTVGNLKKIIIGELSKNYSNHAGVELVYCGSVLDDSAELKAEGVKPGCTIHVFEKNITSEPESLPLTDDSIKCAVVAYRRILSFCHGHGFPKIIYPVVLNKILLKYPEFYNDFGAFAILNDCTLLVKMVRSGHARSMGEQYPILINAAVFIADTIISNLKTNANPSLQSSTADTSDAEMSENNLSQEYFEDHRVNLGQLAAARFSARSVSNSSTSIGPSSSIQSSNNSQQYVAELQAMREIGLGEANSNLQALILCNGNVEEAVNLVLGIGHFS